jgi:acyl-coenzyme A thioesterase PaaI-like protein
MLKITKNGNVMGTANRRVKGQNRRFLTPPSLLVLEEMRKRIHAECLACNEPMFRLRFTLEREGDLVTRFLPTGAHCSYRRVVHGGVVALLIDEAMTCLLMAHAVEGVTGELKLRYLQPVEVAEIELRTRVTKAFAPLYHLESELRQGGVMRVRGHGRFLQRTEETKDKEQ